MKNARALDSQPMQSIRQLRAELARKIACFIGSAEKLATQVPGLLLARRTGPTAPCSGTYEASLIVVAQGRKRVDLGQTTFIYDESRFLLTSVDLPIISQVIEASASEPCLALALKLEISIVRELLTREEVHVGDLASDTPAMITGEITVELLSAAAGWLICWKLRNTSRF